ncbi:putative DNA ligase-like protein [Crateriforma conspicua]|uniref:DNA ligase (ATP) n=1 Tax=Crateriforma conspicua TaxID=2527996 RepID=A0A5C6FVQ1_9PLAN|nr:ATP-dependent DNA ligase [Crateriforma conspicua]TWU67087.1 putative DNA ligase-like protein [Crateriforma conspicua]
MIRFAQLFARLDETTKTNEKIDAIAEYLDDANPADAAWAVYFLSGQRRRRSVPTKSLRQWAGAVAGLSDWLVDESYHAVGDLAETISLIVPPGDEISDLTLAQWVSQRLDPLASMDETAQRQAVLRIWNETNMPTRLVAMKLITGAFRVGVSKRLVTRALAKHSGVPVDVVADRLMGQWQPSEEAYRRWTDPTTPDRISSQPYPFCLAHPIDSESDVSTLGPREDYLAEWKWDGIRGQLIRRDGKSFLWSRGEELMENRWPEIESAAQWLPDGTVLDGEILATAADGRVMPFAQLQRRINRKTVGKKLLAEVPVVFHVFDLLEIDGVDLRDQPLEVRRQRLDQTLAQIDHPHLRPTEILTEPSWDDLTTIRQTSRQRRSEGLMLKRIDSKYDVGRVRGTWWKWKVDPFTIDAVLIYAQKGHGKRASLFTDYTFALWNDGELVPFAKAYSGLDDAEIRKVDRFVRDHTDEAFGPVRRVTPSLVMELAFEGLQVSTRHKSGIATRFPRIVRWRHDKGPQDANSLDELKAMMPDGS